MVCTHTHSRKSIYASLIHFLLNHRLLSVLSSAGGGNCQELMDWYVDYDSSLKWCSDTHDKVKKRTQPGEYIILVERQHGEIEVDMICNSSTSSSHVLFGRVRTLSPRVRWIGLRCPDPHV
jgi:hypothetical protein